MGRHSNVPNVSPKVSPKLNKRLPAYQRKDLSLQPRALEPWQLGPGLGLSLNSRDYIQALLGTLPRRSSWPHCRSAGLGLSSCTVLALGYECQVESRRLPGYQGAVSERRRDLELSLNVWTSLLCGQSASPERLAGPIVRPWPSPIPQSVVVEDWCPPSPPRPQQRGATTHMFHALQAANESSNTTQHG